MNKDKYIIVNGIYYELIDSDIFITDDPNKRINPCYGCVFDSNSDCLIEELKIKQCYSDNFKIYKGSISDTRKLKLKEIFNYD